MNETLKIVACGAVACVAVAAIYYSNKSIVTDNQPLADGLNKKRVNCDSSFLFVGDSNTASPYSYADKLKNNCPNITIKKLAKSGEKTDWMLSQLNNELKTGNKYNVITVLGGSNDIFARLSIDKAKENLQKMYDLAKLTGAKVVAITPPNKSFYEPTTEKHRKLIRELTEWIRNNKSVDVFIDLGALSNDKKYFASDNQHLNSLGNDMLKNEYLKKVFA